MSLSTCPLTASRSVDCSTLRGRGQKSRGHHSLSSCVEQPADECMQIGEGDVQRPVMSVYIPCWQQMTSLLSVCISLFVCLFRSLTAQRCYVHVLTKLRFLCRVIVRAFSHLWTKSEIFIRYRNKAKLTIDFM